MGRINLLAPLWFLSHLPANEHLMAHAARGSHNLLDNQFLIVEFYWMSKSKRIQHQQRGQARIDHRLFVYRRDAADDTIHECLDLGVVPLILRHGNLLEHFLAVCHDRDFAEILNSANRRTLVALDQFLAEAGIAESRVNDAGKAAVGEMQCRAHIFTQPANGVRRLC